MIKNLLKYVFVNILIKMNRVFSLRKGIRPPMLPTIYENPVRNIFEEIQKLKAKYGSKYFVRSYGSYQDKLRRERPFEWLMQYNGKNDLNLL
jgi:hypothetical protein